MIPPGTKQCPNCGVILPGSALSCSRCGATTAMPPSSNSMHCPRCHQPILLGSYQCPHCHQLLSAQPFRAQSLGMLGENHLIVVALVSVLVAGWVGTFLNGQNTKGIWALVISFAFCIVGFLTCGLGLIGLAIFEIILKIDAILIASKLQKGIPVRPNEWF